jgi:hypothetical protein
MTEAYRSYLLRLWLEPDDPPAWRAILESPVNGERRGFANIPALFMFLEQETKRLEGISLSAQEKAPREKKP